MLHIAAGHGLTDICKHLIDFKARVDITSAHYATPLAYATHYNRVDTVKFLLENKADVNGKRDSANDVRRVAAPILLACAKGLSKITRLLVDYRCDLTLKDNTESTPLIVATKNKQFEVAKILADYSERFLKENPDAKEPLDVDHISLYGTALTMTLQHRECGFADKLLSIRADPNTHEDKTAPPLISACKIEHSYLVKKLIDQKADINKLFIDPSTMRNPPSTPLSVSLKVRSFYQVKTLLDRRADPNRRLPPNGDSHTMYAARLAKEFYQTHQNSEKGKEHQKLVKTLVDHGANCDIMNDVNDTLWDIVGPYPEWKEKLYEARRKYHKRLRNKEEHNRRKQMNITNKNAKKMTEEFSDIQQECISTFENQPNLEESKSSRKKKRKKRKRAQKHQKRPSVEERETPPVEEEEQLVEEEEEPKLVKEKPVVPSTTAITQPEHHEFEDIDLEEFVTVSRKKKKKNRKEAMSSDKKLQQSKHSSFVKQRGREQKFGKKVRAGKFDKQGSTRKQNQHKRGSNAEKPDSKGKTDVKKVNAVAVGLSQDPKMKRRSGNQGSKNQGNIRGPRSRERVRGRGSLKDQAQGKGKGPRGTTAKTPRNAVQIQSEPSEDRRKQWGPERRKEKSKQFAKTKTERKIEKPVEEKLSMDDPSSLFAEEDWSTSPVSQKKSPKQTSSPGQVQASQNLAPGQIPANNQNQISSHAPQNQNHSMQHQTPNQQQSSPRNRAQVQRPIVSNSEYQQEGNPNTGFENFPPEQSQKEPMQMEAPLQDNRMQDQYSQPRRLSQEGVPQTSYENTANQQFQPPEHQHQPESPLQYEEPYPAQPQEQFQEQNNFQPETQFQEQQYQPRTEQFSEPPTQFTQESFNNQETHQPSNIPAQQNQEQSPPFQHVNQYPQNETSSGYSEAPNQNTLQYPPQQNFQQMQPEYNQPAEAVPNQYQELNQQQAHQQQAQPQMQQAQPQMQHVQPQIQGMQQNNQLIYFQNPQSVQNGQFVQTSQFTPHQQYMMVAPPQQRFTQPQMQFGQPRNPYPNQPPGGNFQQLASSGLNLNFPPQTMDQNHNQMNPMVPQSFLPPSPNPHFVYVHTNGRMFLMPRNQIPDPNHQAFVQQQQYSQPVQMRVNPLQNVNHYLLQQQQQQQSQQQPPQQPQQAQNFQTPHDIQQPIPGQNMHSPQQNMPVPTNMQTSPLLGSQQPQDIQHSVIQQNLAQRNEEVYTQENTPNGMPNHQQSQPEYKAEKRTIGKDRKSASEDFGRNGKGKKKRGRARDISNPEQHLPANTTEVTVFDDAESLTEQPTPEEKATASKPKPPPGFQRKAESQKVPETPQEPLVGEAFESRHAQEKARQPSPRENAQQSNWPGPTRTNETFQQTSPQMQPHSQPPLHTSPPLQPHSQPPALHIEERIKFSMNPNVTPPQSQKRGTPKKENRGRMKNESKMKARSKGDPTRSKEPSKKANAWKEEEQNESGSSPPRQNTETKQPAKPMSWSGRIGSKPKPTELIRPRMKWNVKEKTSGENELTLYLPDLKVETSWKILTQPLLKIQGELHKKLMSQCGCKISIQGLSGSDKEGYRRFLKANPRQPGVISINSDVGERKNIVDAADRLLSIFNKVLDDHKLARTSIAQLSTLNSRSKPQNQQPEFSRQSDSKSNKHQSTPPLEKSPVESVRQPAENMRPPPMERMMETNIRPVQPRERNENQQSRNVYHLKKAPKEASLLQPRCQWCEGLEPCEDPERCWFLKAV